MTYIPDPLRALVIARAKSQCEYCLLHADYAFYTHEVDHIIPEQHLGETTEDNLCYSCLQCNRSKGANFNSFDPQTRDVTFLFNPRTDNWAEHFELDDARIVPKTAIGRVIELILNFNNRKRLEHRTILFEKNRYPLVEGDA